VSRVDELERMLDELDEIDAMEHEDKVNLILGILEQMGFFRSPEVMKMFFKRVYMREPELLEVVIDHYRDRWTKELRKALKQARRKAKIVRK